MATPRRNTPRYCLFDEVVFRDMRGQVVSATYNVHGERVYGICIDVPESELRPARDEEAL